ncbi:MAG: hypothetical protein HFG30_08450 [Eubacterium sp.]|jgi:hypothetical protein|nr:hypothetical protein [Eubacterium sp.]
MLQARRKSKIKVTVLVVSILCVLSLGVAVGAAFLNTNRDTRPAPDKVTSDMKVTSAYQFLCQVGDYKYYFRDDRDIIAVENTKTGYVWKTGIDTPLPSQIEEAFDIVKEAKESGSNEDIIDYADELDLEGTDAQKIKQVKEIADSPIDSSFQNDQYAAYSNSLLTVEYFTGSGKSMKTTRVSSAAEDDKEGTSGLQVQDEAKHIYKLECKFALDDKDLGVNVYITFGEDGKINYSVPYKEITGDAIGQISKVVITPFLGASGGALKYFDNKEEDWVNVKANKITPGYALIPDGSGSLIRFQENKAKFTAYEGAVYNDDPSKQLTYKSVADDVVPVKDPTMPVFGISHGDGTQAAFVAYADKGDEYMTLNAVPASTDEGEIRYTYAYAGFTYNSEFYQVINQAGESYRKVQDEPNKFDIDLTYQFLSGDGSDGTPSADYVGMAKAYRQHLIDEKVLTEIKQEGKDIPIRIDFLMSDSKKGVFSTQEVAVTSAKDVDEILEKLSKDGIRNINSGLIGWQSGGETMAKPNSTSISGNVGSKSEFEDLMTKYAEKGIDISLSREFTTINEDMISYYNNAAKHLNTKYLEVDQSTVLPKNVPVAEFGYALPKKTASWITDLYEDLGDYSKSFTIDGASDVLVSSYDSDGVENTVTDAITYYQDAIEKIKKNGTKANLVSPNKYLWKYTDRYLQSTVGTSQYVYETDTVPFLQMVLHGTMEVYAPYANFSFYSTTDQLRMIDYNINPSFVLTKKPSYLLSATKSSDYYSTEFEQYEELVKNIYATVNKPLSQVIGYSWTGRNVVEDGVIANTYEKDGDIKTVIINYTEDEVTVNGNKVAKLSAAVVEGGVQ